MQDIYYWTHGGKSVFGELLGAFDEFSKHLDPFFQSFEGWKTTLDGVLKLVQDIKGEFKSMSPIDQEKNRQDAWGTVDKGLKQLMQHPTLMGPLMPILMQLEFLARMMQGSSTNPQKPSGKFITPEFMWSPSAYHAPKVHKSTNYFTFHVQDGHGAIDIIEKHFNQALSSFPAESTA